MRDAERMRS